MVTIAIKKQLFGAEGSMQLDITLDIASASFLSIAGASGSGKTTLLRILAGFEEAEGTIVVDEEVWLSPTHTLPPQQRSIGFVFQDHALFENMSVVQNLLFVNKDPKLAQHLLELTELSQLRDRMPHTLSGGQKQRVGLCRAMMRKPKLLLLDEPFSALDPKMRTKLQEELLLLHKEFGTTTIMTSHDPKEIERLSDTVVTLHNGTILDKREAHPLKLLDKEILSLQEENGIYTATLQLRFTKQ